MSEIPCWAKKKQAGDHIYNVKKKIIQINIYYIIVLDIHPFIQELFIEHLLCIRHHTKISAHTELTFQWGRCIIKKRNKQKAYVPCTKC